MPLSDHEVGAALCVARRLDPGGNDAVALTRTLQHTATDGVWLFEDLSRGRALLAEAGLLVESDTVVAIDPLPHVARMRDSEAVAILRRLIADGIAGEANQSARHERGASAERLVVQECRAQLVALGRSDLAADVQQVSQISDHFGYDVSAPRIGGTSRLLEVKGSARTGGSVFEFYLSRNEFDVGTRHLNSWWLVACDVSSDPRVVGHCSAAAVASFLPSDDRGRWTEALVRMPSHLLVSGLPSPVA